MLLWWVISSSLAQNETSTAENNANVTKMKEGKTRISRSERIKKLQNVTIDFSEVHERYHKDLNYFLKRSPNLEPDKSILEPEFDEYDTNDNTTWKSYYARDGFYLCKNCSFTLFYEIDRINTTDSAYFFKLDKLYQMDYVHDPRDFVHKSLCLHWHYPVGYLHVGPEFTDETKVYEIPKDNLEWKRD